MNDKQIEILENLLLPLSTKEVLNLTHDIKKGISEIPEAVQIRNAQEDTELDTRYAEKAAQREADSVEQVDNFIDNYQDERLQAAKDIYNNFLANSDLDIDFPIEKWIEEYPLLLSDVVDAYKESSEEKLLWALNQYVQCAMEIYANHQSGNKSKVGNSLFDFFNSILSVPNKLEEQNKNSEQMNNAMKKPWFSKIHSILNKDIATNRLTEKEIKNKLFTSLSKIEQSSFHPNHFQYFLLASSYNHKEYLDLFENKLKDKSFEKQLGLQISDLIYNTKNKLEENDKRLSISSFVKNHSDYFPTLYLFNLDYFYNTCNNKNIEFSMPGNADYWRLSLDKTPNHFLNKLNTFALKNILQIDPTQHPLCTKVLSSLLDSVIGLHEDIFINGKELSDLKIMREKQRLNDRISVVQERVIENKNKFKI